MKYATISRALVRMSGPMLVQHLRRQARDRLVPRLAPAFSRRLENAARAMPRLRARPALPIPLAHLIAAFYAVEEQDLADAGEGRFTFLGKTVDFGGIDRIDWQHRLPEEHDHHLWRMKLCQMEILHSLLARGTVADQACILALLDRFDQASDFTAPGIFTTLWSPYGASHRMLAMLSGLALADSDAFPPELRKRIDMFIRRDAAFVQGNIEHDLRNNHTERNLAALCLYGMISAPLPVSLRTRLDRDVGRIIHDTILADGMQIERSAMYQGLTVMSLRIFAASPFLSKATRKLAADSAERASHAWSLMTHEDGEVALFNDSWIEEVPSARDVLDTPASRHIGSSLLRDAGYGRIGWGSFSLWMDAGAIGPVWNPGHGHADFLAIELDADGKRLIVDPGTSQYSTGVVRSFERSAASHNGPVYIGVEPVDYLGRFKVGRMVAARLRSPDHLPDGAECALGGSLRLKPGAIGRLVVGLEHNRLLIADHWTAAKPGEVQFLFPGEWRVDSAGPSTLRLLHGDGDGSVLLRALSGRFEAPEQGQWCRRFMRPEAATRIALRPDRSARGQGAMLLIGDGDAPPASLLAEVASQVMKIAETA